MLVTLINVAARVVLDVEHGAVACVALSPDLYQELLSLWLFWTQGFQDCQADLPLDSQAGGAGMSAEAVLPGWCTYQQLMFCISSRGSLSSLMRWSSMKVWE
jgi:hypothetical protein